MGEAMPRLLTEEIPDIDPDLIRKQEEVFNNGPIAYNENRAFFTCPRCGRDYSTVIRIFAGEVVSCMCGYRAA